MKKITLVILFFIPLSIFSQELKLSSRVGYAIIKGEHFKKIALSTGTFIGSEFILNEFLYLNTLIGYSSIGFDYEDLSNSNTYTTKYYLCLPVSLKKYYPLSKRSSLFFEFGVSFNYDFITNKEIFAGTGSQISRQNGVGFSLSGIGGFGFKTQITKRLFFDVGLCGQADVVYAYKNETDKLKTNRKMFSLTLYQKLKR